MAVYVLNPAVGVGDKEFGGNELLDGEDDTSGDADANGGSAVLDSFAGVLNLYPPDLLSAFEETGGLRASWRRVDGELRTNAPGSSFRQARRRCYLNHIQFRWKSITVSLVLVMLSAILPCWQSVWCRGYEWRYAVLVGWRC